jgi:hypothetical protein
MGADRRILTEIDRSKQLIQYTTKHTKKSIPEIADDKKNVVEEGKIITLTEFIKR